MRNFTHLDDTGFPYPEGIDPYKYENDFNYNQYDKTQMTITVCSVPWDVGLIHVGNAQIGGLGNVVKFESPEARDAWLDSIENKYTWETKYREYHTGGYIEVPLPYEKAVLYNYVYVEYNTLPVDYAEGGKKRFFFFIRSCEALAPSTCKIELLRDTFQTFIYDVNVKHLMLERGHAPMALNSADRYLSNPIENNEYLLAEDINFSGAYRRKYATSKIFNSGDMWAVIISSGNPRGAWGTKSDNTWTTPDGVNMLDGQPTYYAMAVEPSNLNTLLNNIDAQVPQFKSTIKGVFFVARNLVTTGNAYSFASVNVRPVSQKTQTIDFLQLTKAQFDYGPKYENLAKLYTFPYAYLEITSEDGNASIVKIEETSGNLSLAVTTSLAYPWLAIDSHINGIGTGAATIEFSNINEHSFSFSGDWYSQLRRWNIPCFAVTQAASVAYDYSSHFDRLQQAEENSTALANALGNAATAHDNANASAETVYINTEASAATSKTNADASASTTYTNANAIAATALANANANADTTHGNAYRDAQANRTRFTNERGLAQAQTNLLTSGEYSPGYSGFIGASAWENISKISDDWDADWLLANVSSGLSISETAMTSVINGVGGAVSSAIGNAAAGLVAGPGGAGVGAVTGLVGGSISLAQTSMSLPIVLGAQAQLNQAQLACGNDKISNAINYAQNMATLQSNLEQDKTSTDNQWLTINADLVKDTAEDDADDVQTTAKANAQRNYDTDTSNNLRTYNTALSNNTNTYNTDIDNNERSYDTALDNALRTYNNAVAIANRNKQTADDAIVNGIKQAGLEAPKEFGDFANGETSVTRPQGIFCNIVTQAKDAIAQTGDYFLRFGYAVNRAWDFTDFNIMPKFTYWKASDMWISGNNVPDAYLDEIRFFFLGGVCVWRRPEDIGNISIYENN